MNFKEWWDEYGNIRGCDSFWTLNTKVGPYLIFRAVSYAKLDSVHQDMADHWPGEILYLPCMSMDADAVRRDLEDWDRLGEALEEGEKLHAASPLDADQWEGTLEHACLALGRQMDHIEDLSVDIVDPDDLNKLSGKMCEAARIIAALFCLGLVDDDI